MPKVSVIIPTFNRGYLINRAINSVLMQTYRDYEIVVVDDGSTDNTLEVLEAHKGRIKYIRQENRGISGARNCGIEESSGEYIAFLDSDDEWIPEKLEIQTQILDKNKSVGIVYSKMIILDEDHQHCGFKPEEPTGRNFAELVEIRGDITTSTVLTRSECFKKVGIFDTDLPPMEDFEMWLRIARFYEIYEVKEPILAYYYQHKGQVTQNVLKVYRGLVKLEEKILKSYNDIPKRIVMRRLVMNQYLLGRVYYNDGDYVQSLRNISQTLGRDPFVGKLFWEKKDKGLRKAFKFIKPYGFWIICLLKLCCGQFKKEVNQ